MPLELWSSRDLYQVITDDRLARPTTYWRDTYFGRQPFFSQTEDIIFSQLPTSRRLAPFVLPTEQGKPIYRREGETLKAFRPAYIKPKDSIRPVEVIARNPSEILRDQPMSYEERFDAEVVNIVNYHDGAIRRQWDWMCARAIIDGSNVINYHRDQGDDFPNVTIDWGRDPDLTITLGVGTTWDDLNEDILEDIQSWIDLGASKPFGGAFSRLYLGSAVAPYFRKNAGIKEAMNTQFRGTADINVNRGLVRQEDGNAPVFLGTLGVGIDVYRYADQIQADDGTMIDVLDPKDIVMTAPGVDGLPVFGAIHDIKAGLVSIDIFLKMWDNEDPSARYIMSQSAPLFIPVYPNRTLKARVLP